MSQLDTALKKKVKDNESRTWFLQLFDDKKNLIWKSGNAPILEPPSFLADVNGPYDEKKQETHRVYEKYLRKASGENYYIRCGFLQIALQDDIDLLNRNLLLASLSILLAAPIGGYVIALR